MPRRIDIDPDVRRARTLPSEVYHDPWWWERQRQRLFPRTWHLVPLLGRREKPGDLRPWTFLPRCLDEPLVLACDEAGKMRCMSNVCTHRGNVLVERQCNARGIRCSYHGRRFALDGRMLSMPEFEDADEFPSASDDLPHVALEPWGRLLFASLEPEHPFAIVLDPLRERLDWLPWHAMDALPSGFREYAVNANWALYCDNYLEGFHIPFVHPGLARALDYASYQTELLPLGVLQIGVAETPAEAFAPPASHRDHGKGIAGYYYWLFPCTMLNIYPWGMSVNAVLPLGPQHSRIVYQTWVWDPERYDTGAGADLDRVEHEDEVVVEACARGVRSRLYDRGRYSPSRERGVHHFHRLLARFLDD